MRNRDPRPAACALLFFLLLTPVSPKCQKAAAEECVKADFVPGSYLAGNGFDIRELTMREKFWANVEHWKTADGGCILCENPLLEGRPLQRLPVIVTDWRAQASCEQEVQHSVQHSVIAVAGALTKLRVKNDWRKELDVKISPSAKVQWALAGSRSKMTQDCLKKNSQDKYIFLLHHITCSYYKFRVSQVQFLSDHFELSVKTLPEYYGPSSKLKYRDLIRTYGTHFGTELDLGAHIRFLTAVPACRAAMENISVSELSLCLAVDAGVAFGFKGVTDSPDFQMCEEKKKNSNFLLLLSKMGEERWGGRLSSNSTKEWLESAKSTPALLSYSLEPLHALLDQNSRRRGNLRKAVSEYVREKALWRNCNQACPAGSQPSAEDFCSCECPNDNFTNSMCCAQKRGLARMTVTIERAEGLWGDYFSRSDGYVRASFQRREMRTFTVWNNNDPTWNVTFDFGVIHLHEEFNKLVLQVMDEDFGWDDDLLGVCKLTLEPWRFESQSCHLDFGHLLFKYRLACGPHLHGPSCSHYSFPSPNDDDYYNYDSY